MAMIIQHHASREQMEALKDIFIWPEESPDGGIVWTFPEWLLVMFATVQPEFRNCEICGGTRPNAVAGNGQWIDGVLHCDDCHADYLSRRVTGNQETT